MLHIFAYHFVGNMCSDHTVYLTSSGSRELFPDNTPGRFINRLSSPIMLDNNTDYEVGLISILYPDQYYAILANDEEYAIAVHTSQKMINTSLIVDMKQNILAGDIGKIIKTVNSNLLEYLKAHFHSFYPHLFSKHEKILKWNEIEGRVEINCKLGDSKNKIVKDIEKITINLKPGLANILGFPVDAEYTIYSKIQQKRICKSPMPPSPRCGVDYIYMYTDIIQPINFGGQLVNVLDCFTLQNGGNKGIHNSVYKTLNTRFIDQISIFISDQKGRHIHFLEDTTLTCVLHIRPK